MNYFAEQRRAAIGRTAVIAVIVVILVIAVVAGVYLSTKSTTSTSTTGTSTSSSSSSSTSTGASGTYNTLTVNDESWPTGDLNQLNAIGAIPYPNWLDYSVYQSLVTVNGTELYQNGTISLEPMLATSWNSSASGTTWTMYLRHGVTFSNSDPFNAYQVWGEMYGFYYLSANTSGWAVGYNVFNMTTADFGPSTIALMSSTKSQMITPTSQMLSIMENSSWPIYVINQYELGFNLKAAFQWFPQMWVQFTGLIFDTQYVLNNGGFGTPGAFNTAFNYAPIPGTGPYEVVDSDVVPNSAVTMVQYSGYWAKNWTAAEIQANPYVDPGHVNTIVVTVQSDDATRYVDLSSGSAYIAPILSQDWGSVISNPSKFSYFQMPSDAANIVGIAMNTQRYPTNNTDFRLAIAYAINYTQISDDVFLGTEGGGLSPMMGPEYPAFSQLYDLGNVAPYNYSVTLAQQYLKASGINTAKLTPMQFAVVQGCGVCDSTAELVVSDLQAIGIPATVDVVTPSQYGPPLVAGSGTYAQEVNESSTIANLMWFGTATFAPDEPTPADSLLTWVSNETSANNWAIYSNPTVQQCINDLTNGASQSTLITDCTAMQKTIAEQAPYIWLGSVKLFFGGGSIVYNNNVVKSFLADPVFSGQSATAILNTVEFVNGQDE